MRCALLMMVALLGLGRPAGGQDNACGTRHVVTIEADGRASRGSKEQLRRVVANGLSVRVGLQVDSNGDGVPEVSHWADAGFLTEFEGEVFAQLADIQRQTPLRGQARMPMPAGRQRWSGLIGTNGTLESHFRRRLGAAIGAGAEHVVPRHRRGGVLGRVANGLGSFERPTVGVVSMIPGPEGCKRLPRLRASQLAAILVPSGCKG